MYTKGDKVNWVDGIGFEHTGTIDQDTDSNEFMIPVRTNDDRILRIAYKNLHHADLEEVINA